MNLVPGISLYNQDRLDDEDFVDNFVARLEMVEVLLNVLRQAAGGGETEHQVLVGARGMGKTSLLRRLAIAIGRDERLRTQFIPLRFREEQYNVISLDTFWRNCGEALAEWCEANGDHDTAERIDQATDSPDWRAAEKAADAFLAFCADLARRPCLLVDNLDLVLDGLRDEGWALRHVLQRPGGPVVVGAASQMLSQGAERDGPFYEFFHPLLLEPLSEAELLRCMHSLADRRGKAGARVKTVLAKAPERIRTLYALTGGNPRILSLIYQLMERAETDTIFADLEALLDQVTPFYKARIEEYTGPQQRAIIDAIALNWDPITSSALGEVTGIEVTTISSQLAPLRRDGFIERVPTSGARDGYQLGERFLNIWYLMRHGTRKTRQRLRWLTIFLTKLFDAEELGKMAAEARDVARCVRWHPDFREAVIEAYDTAQSMVSGPFATATVDRESTNEAVKTENSDAAALLLRARQYWSNREFEMVVATSDEFISRFGDAEGLALQGAVALSLISRGVALGQLGRRDEELATYEEIMDRFGNASEPTLQEKVADALVYKGFALRQLGRNEEAVAAYEEIERRFGDDGGLPLQIQVAKAFFDKGLALRQLGRAEEAITAYDEVAVRFGESAESRLQEQVARALVSKGFALSHLNRGEQEIVVYDEIISWFGDGADPALQVQVATALVAKGVALGQLNRGEEEIAAYDEVMVRFGDAAEPLLQEQVAKALVNKGIVLCQLDRCEESICSAEEVLRRFGEVDSRSLHEQIAKALTIKGVALGQLGRTEEWIASAEEVVRRFGDAAQLSLRRFVGRALITKGVALGQLGRHEEWITSAEEVVRRFGDAAELSLQEHVAGALFAKGIALGQVGRAEEAIAAHDQVICRFRGATDSVLQERVAWAYGMKGRILLDAFARYEEAEACCHEALAIRFDLTDATNLVWTLIAQKRDCDAEGAREKLADIDLEGMALVNAGIEIVRDNLGSALGHLGEALDKGLEPDVSAYFEDILWLLRIGVDQGYGEKLIDWFVESGNAERYAPIYGALVARVCGERFLLDLNPEVRPKASDFYRVLAVTAVATPAAKGKRGRRRGARSRKPARAAAFG